MRKILISTLALSLTVALFVPGQARAAHRGVEFSWSIASSFQIGGADVALVLGRPAAYVAGYGPTYYFRTRRPLPGFYGPACGDCFAANGFYFYDVASPVVSVYFTRYGFPVDRFWLGVAPYSYRPPLRLYRSRPRGRIYGPPVRRFETRGRYFVSPRRSYAPRSYRGRLDEPRRRGHEVRDRGRRGARHERGHGRHR